MTDTQPNTEDWEAAYAHFMYYMEMYRSMLGQPDVMVGPALMVVFEPLLRRYNSGERSQKLYDEMMGVE